MALRISIYLPEASIERTSEWEDLVISLGDIVSVGFGNNLQELESQEKELEDLKSFIIINEADLPSPENFEGKVLIIPVEE